MTTTAHLPVWVGVPVIIFLLLGSLLTFIGALGLFRLPHFYQRIHGPAVMVTLGLGCIVIASILLFSYWQSRPVIHEWLITLFIFMTTPISAMLIMRSAKYRHRK